MPTVTKDDPRPRRWRTNALVAGLLLGAVAVIGTTRSGLAEQCRRAKYKYDIYALPKPSHVVTMSLGYRSALADLLLAHVLVQSGIHLSEKRRFESLASYLRTINELDPRFATPYHFADTLLTMQAGTSTMSDYLAARGILERGMDELKYDLELWLTAGQFMAYVAPPHIQQLAGERAAAEWRHAGMMRLARSCELVGANEQAPRHCANAARLMSRAGEYAALQQFVERVVAVNDDPEVQERALATLARATGEEKALKLVSRRERYERVKRTGLAFVGKDAFLLLGPRFDAYACLGDAAAADCATTFADYHRRLDLEEGSMP